MQTAYRTTSIGKRILDSLPFAITAVLIAVAVVNLAGGWMGSLPPDLSRMMDLVSGFSAVFMGIFIEAAPYLLLGTLASGLVETFVSRDDLTRWIPRNAVGGALVGGVLGLFFPVCECGVVPFVRRMVSKGLPMPAAVALLLAAPVVNPIVIASTLAAFGPGLVVWGRLGFSLLVAVLMGSLFGLAGPNQVLSSVSLPAEMPGPILTSIDAMPAQKPPLKERFKGMLVIAADEFFEMGRFLILGALLAAAMQTVVPQASLLALGQGPLLSVFVMMLLAILLSICSTVDAFIALAFTGAFSTGSILAFLVYGPMVDIKSTLMFLRVFKPRMVIYLVVLPFLMTALIGFLVNIL
ncbi:MAG: permease [Anaerolineae bacterium]|nr:permease [Anaerolineae bacterium]